MNDILLRKYDKENRVICLYRDKPLSEEELNLVIEWARNRINDIHACQPKRQ